MSMLLSLLLVSSSLLSLLLQTNPIVVTAGVSQIIESVIGALLLNPDRTFVFADMVSVQPVLASLFNLLVVASHPCAALKKHALF